MSKEIKVNESIKFAYFFTNKTTIFKLFQKNENMTKIDLYNRNLDWIKQSKQTNLSDFSIIFLDGGNPTIIHGTDLMGNEIADYVDNGGVVCTLGPSNAKDSHYSIKGRWKEERYQPVHGKLKFFFEYFIILIFFEKKIFSNSVTFLRN